MLPILLTLFLVVPTLFLVPYFPHILAVLIISYLMTRIMQAKKLRSIRKLAEKKGEKSENSGSARNKRESAKKVNNEYESDFIEKTTDIIAYLSISLIVSILILHFSVGLAPLVGKVLLLTVMICLITAMYINILSPLREDERKWQKNYRDFCKSYMDEKYQEFLIDEREQKRQEGIREEHEHRWLAKHGERRIDIS